MNDPGQFMRLFVLIFCLVSLGFSSNLSRIASEIKSKKLSLKGRIEEASAVLRSDTEVDFAAVERLCAALLSCKMVFRNSAYMVDFSLALAKHVVIKSWMLPSLDQELLKSALFLTATSGSAEATPDHEEALLRLAETLTCIESKRAFLLKSATLLDPSTSIFPCYLFTDSNYFIAKDVPGTVESHLTTILEKHPSLPNLHYEHLFNFARILFDYNILIESKCRMILYSFFIDRAIGLNDPEFIKKCARLIMANYPFLDSSGHSLLSKEQAHKLINFLINDQVLGLLSDVDIYFVYTFGTHVKKADEKFFNSRVAALSGQGKEYLTRLAQVSPNIEELLTLMTSVGSCLRNQISPRGTENLLSKFRSMFRDPRNAFFSAALRDIQYILWLLCIRTDKDPNHPLYEVNYCLAFELGYFRLSHWNEKSAQSLVSMSLTTMALAALIKLEATGQATAVSTPSLALIDDALIEKYALDLFGSCDSSPSRVTSFETAGLVIFFQILRKHSSPSWTRTTISKLLIFYLVQTTLEDYKKAFELRHQHAEMDAFCWMNCFEGLMSQKLDGLSQVRLKGFALLLSEYEGFNATQKEIIKAFA